jgi:uncharacterized repeat protein (TIGR01451 family)/CSLREA domain-containing protein
MSSTIAKLALLLLLAFPLSGVTVNNLGDASDANPGNGVCATAGSVCTLRAAIEETNALGGTNDIFFSVAGTIAPASAYPPITHPLLIDGSSAPGYAGVPLVIIDGGGVIARGFDFAAGSDDSQVRAMRLYGFTDAGVSISSARVAVVNNYLGPIGGGTPNRDGLHLQATSTAANIGFASLRNVISGNTRNGIRIEGSNHSVQNNYIGTDVAGMAALPNGEDGVYITGATGVLLGTPDGGPYGGAKNVISGNGGNGVTVTGSSGNIIGGWIGVNSGASAALANGGDGIALLNGANDNVVGNDDGLTIIAGNTGNGVSIDASCAGTLVRSSAIGTVNDPLTDPVVPNGTHGISDAGTTTVIANTISGNAVDGIHLGATANGTIIRSNRIGSMAGERTKPNGRHGIGADAARNVTIGGALGDGNLISTNTANGIAVSGAANGVAITANLIDENGLLGIDLGADGVTPNDPLDTDGGPNALQNFPLLTSAVITATETVVQGTLNSTPNSSFALHFYRGDAPDPSGFGEGATYIGSANVTTNASGDAAFSFTVAGNAAGVVTATATGVNGTSEFSAAAVLVSAPSIQFSSPAYSSSETAAAATITVTRTGDLSATSTVHYATADGSATQPADYAATSGTLTFAPGVTSQTFTVAIVNDALAEPDETINLTLTAPTAATLGTQSAATLTIVDNDGSANLSITKTPSAATFVPGQQVTFTIAVANTGPNGASNVTVTDVPPAGLTFVSATSATFNCTGTSTISCTAPTLVNGATGTIAIVVTANGMTPITNRATVTADQSDPASTNNAANATISPGATIPTLTESALLALLLVIAAIGAMKLR